MIKESWQLETTIDALVFDCDGTLSTIEGIDELAEENAVSARVKALTAEAMGKTGMNPDLYKERLDLVQPRRAQVEALGEKYFLHRIAAIKEVLQIFQRLNKPIFIVSAGMNPAVKIFAELLDVPKQNVFAVDLQFDVNGNYVDYDRQSPFAHADGKMQIVSEIKMRHPEIFYVGDGLNDLPVKDLVRRFVGFGGAYFRENIAERCDFYLLAATMTPLLALALTQEELSKLTVEEDKLYREGMSCIEAGKLKMK